MWIFPQVKTRYDLGVFVAGANVHDKIALLCIVWLCFGTFYLLGQRIGPSSITHTSTGGTGLPLIVFGYVLVFTESHTD